MASQTELERMRRTLDESGLYHVLERYQRRAGYATAAADTEIRLGLYVDVETTGLSSHQDRIIELGLVSFEFDREGRVYALRESASYFEDPGRPIPAEITQLTGITDDDVRGQRIPDAHVLALVAEAHLVIAHNAAFDRPFLERRLPAFEAKAWACSASDVPWRAEGLEGRKLEYLCMKAGFVYDGHRAEWDCLAGVELLCRALPRSGRSALGALLASARRPEARLWAVDSPFASKELLKRRGYRWHGRCWYTDLPRELASQEADWLREAVYAKPVNLPYVPITAFVRYSARVPAEPPADAARL